MSAWVRRNKLSIMAATLLLGLLPLSLICWQFTSGTSSFQFGFPVLAPSLTHTLTPSAVPTLTRTPIPTLTSTPTPTATSTPTSTPSPTPPLARVLSVPIILQESPLSCECAAIRMVLAALFGSAPSEKELLECMPRNPNPYLGFRGDPYGRNRFPDGSINWDNYGAYAPVVAETLNRCVLRPSGKEFEALAVSGASYEQVSKAVLDGYPVIVWVAKRPSPETTNIDTPEGPVRLVFGEHVWVVVGYHEDGSFDVHDPYPQKNDVQTFHVRSFPNWDLFERMVVFIRPRKAEPSSYIPTPASTASATLASTVTITSAPAETVAPTVTPRPRAYSPPTRIRIPKINVDADVVEVGYEIKEENGEALTVWKVADYAAGFHRGSAYPGHPGNTVIAGHNNIRGRVFRHLLDLLPGDDIYLYVGEQEFHYVVGQRLLIKEKGMSEESQRENAKWIQPTDDERLTLVSCWPFIKPDHRVVVIAWPK